MITQVPKNRAILLTSDDNGCTWAAPVDVTGTLMPKGSRIYGFGPGSRFANGG